MLMMQIIITEMVDLRYLWEYSDGGGREGGAGRRLVLTELPHTVL